MTEIGSAFVSIVPSARGVGKKLDAELGPQLDKSGRAGSKRLGTALSSGLKSALAPALTLLGGAAVGSLLKDSIAEARESQKVGARTANVIKTTGGAAKITAKQIGQLSTSLSNKTGIDDEAIQTGSNLILTFKNIKREGSGLDDVFGRATAAAVDLSASGFGDINGASKQLGKALNDPVKGISALGRAGVTFSAVQKEQIAGFVKSNDLLSAQKIILKEVESQVGGSAAAQATAGEKAKVAFDNLKETIGTALLPTIDKLEVKLTNDIIPAVSSFVTGMQDGTGAGGKVADTLGDIYKASKPIATTLAKIVTTFGSFPGATQKVLLLAGAVLLLKNRYSESLPSLQSFSRESVTTAAKTVAIRGGALAAAGGLAALSSKAGGTSTTLGALSTVAAGVAAGFAIGGPWGAAIGGAGGLLSVFTSRSNAAATAQREFDTAGKAVAATLNEQTGALTKSTRAAAAKALADSGAFNEAKKVGASLRDVLDASLGNAAATRRVNDAIQAYSDAQKQRLGVDDRVAKATKNLRGQIGANSGALSEQRNKIDQVNAAMARGKNKTVTYTVKTSGITGVLDTLAALGRKIAALNVGSNAKGTDNWRGGLTWVGEEGPELINLSKGAQVIPNHKIGDVGRTVSAGDSGASAGYTRLHPSDINAIGNVILAGAGAVAAGAVDSASQFAATTGRMA